MSSYFFLVIRRPPTPPLFPSTPLFRSVQPHHVGLGSSGHPCIELDEGAARRALRSEEHNSELQSHRYISYVVLFFFSNTAPTDTSPLPLHAALPICSASSRRAWL